MYFWNWGISTNTKIQFQNNRWRRIQNSEPSATHALVNADSLRKPASKATDCSLTRGLLQMQAEGGLSSHPSTDLLSKWNDKPLNKLLHPRILYYLQCLTGNDATDHCTISSLRKNKSSFKINNYDKGSTVSSSKITFFLKNASPNSINFIQHIN